MSQAPQGPMPPPMSQQFGPPQQQLGPPPWQQGLPPAAIPQQQWQHEPPMGRPGFPGVSRPARGNGWWTASAVLAFLGAASAVSVLGSIAAMVGFLGFFVAVQGGAEGVRQISDDFVQTTTWLFYLFLAVQLVSIVLGFWGGRNCLRGRASGAFLTMLVGVLALGEVVWLGVVFEAAGNMAVGIVAGLALVVCPAIALRFPQPKPAPSV